MSVKIQNLYRIDSQSPAWTSNYWYGLTRKVSNIKNPVNTDLINMEPDPADPQGVAEIQGAQDPNDKSNSWEWFGNGTMRMKGVYPRIYLNYDKWKNVEITIYYKRLGISGKAADGINIAARSHPKGHQSAEDGKYYAQTHTYYGRLRHDGHQDFAKEFHHRAAMENLNYAGTYRTWGNNKYRKKKQVFSGDFLPRFKWIGWKFVCCNVKGSEGKKVLLQSWIDLKSKGDPLKMHKDNWELVGQVIDEKGKIPGAPSKAYDIFGTSNDDVFDYEGICFLRSGFGDALYKDFSVVPIKEIRNECIRSEPKYRNQDGFIKGYFMNLYNIVNYVGQNALNIVGLGGVKEKELE